MTILRIPSPLRPYAGGVSELQIQAENVGQAIEKLTEQYPPLRTHLFSKEGELRPFVNLFLNEEDVRHLQGQETPLHDGDKLMILPSIAGGSQHRS
ncbi:MAG: MoaD family protein [Anaerolineales bacterium]|jgi:adenylyltransferase/sulfurtransferase